MVRVKRGAVLPPNETLRRYITIGSHGFHDSVKPLAFRKERVSENGALIETFLNGQNWIKPPNIFQLRTGKDPVSETLWSVRNRRRWKQSRNTVTLIAKIRFQNVGTHSLRDYVCYYMGASVISRHEWF
jgi:hypothetical protein